MIFGVLNPEKIWHQHLVHFPTSPVYCSHFTLGNPKKSFFNSIIHSYRLFTLSQKETNCYPFTHHTWKMSPHYLVKCTTFSSDWRYVHVSERWWIWNEPVVGWHWWLCVANGMSGKQRYSKCSKWPPSAQIHASSLFCHWSTVSSTMVCWNAAMSQQDAAVPQLVRIANWYSIHVNKWKGEEFVQFLQGSGATFFRCSG